MAALSTLVDNFNTGVAPDAKWSYNNNGGFGSCSLVGGELKFTFGTTLAYNSPNDLFSVSSFDLTGSSAYVKLVGPAVTTGNVAGTEGGFQIRGGTAPTQEFVGISQTSDNLIYFFAANSALGVFFNSSIAFNASTHAWWRIRESAGTIYWDTAPSTASNPPASGDWVNRATTSTSGLGWAGLGIASTTVRLYSGLTATISPEPAGIRFDGFNTNAGAGSATYNDSRTETATITESPAASIAAVASRTEVATVTETFVATPAYARAVNETMTTTDSVAAAFAYSKGVDETASLTDSWSFGNPAIGGFITETMTASDTVTSRNYWEKVNTAQPVVWTKVVT